MQPSLDGSQVTAFPKASGVNKRSNKYAKYYSRRTAHFATSGGPAGGGGCVLLAVGATPPSPLCTFPVSPPYSVLAKKAFSEHSWFSALGKPVPGSLFCSLRVKEKSVIQEHVFLGKKENAILLK